MNSVSSVVMSMKNIPESHSILPASNQIRWANLPFVIYWLS